MIQVERDGVPYFWPPASSRQNVPVSGDNAAISPTGGQSERPLCQKAVEVEIFDIECGRLRRAVLCTRPRLPKP